MAKLFILADSDSKHVFHKPENLLINLRSRKSQQSATFTLAIKMSNEPIKRRADVCSAVSSFYVTPYCEMDDTGVKPGRKRNRRRDRSFIGLKELNTIQPIGVLSLSFARTNGFLYRVETGGGQTVGRTKQMYAHLQRNHEYLVELGNEWDVEGVRLETPVSSRELRYRVDDSHSISQSQTFGGNHGPFSQHARIPTNWTSYFATPETAVFDSDYFPHIFRTASTSSLTNVEFDYGVVSQIQSCAEEIPYFTPVHAETASPNSAASCNDNPDQYDELSSVASTASRSSSSWNLEDEVPEVTEVTFDTTDPRSYRPPQLFYSLQDPVFDTWNPLAVPVDPLVSSMHSFEAQPFDFPVLDMNTVSYTHEVDSHAYANEEVKGEVLNAYYAANPTSDRGINEDSSISDGTRSGYESNSLDGESSNSSQYSVSPSVSAGSCSQSSPEWSHSSDADTDCMSCWEELMAGTDFASLSNGGETARPLDGDESESNTNENGNGVCEKDDSTNASCSEGQSSSDIPNLDSTTCIPFNYMERRDYYDDSSPLPPPALLANTVTDLCVSVAATIPAKHFQSLFFLVWSFLAQMEMSILMSAIIISQLVQKHSSQLAKSQQTFLFSSHLSDKLTRHSYGAVEFCRSSDFPGMSPSRLFGLSY